MMRKIVERYNRYFVLLFAILLTACTPIRPGEPTATPPPPASALIDGFQWQIDGAFGYRMLRPANWQPVNLGDARGYYPPGSIGETDRLLLVARNLNALDADVIVISRSIFQDHPHLADWTAALEAFWQRNQTTYALEDTLPNAHIYALQSPASDNTLQVVAYIVADDQPLVISLDTFGDYADVQRLRDEGIFADFVTMVASATAVEIDPQQIDPPLMEEDTTAAPAAEATRPATFTSVAKLQAVTAFPVLVPAATISPTLIFVEGSYQTNDRGQEAIDLRYTTGAAELFLQQVAMPPDHQLLPPQEEHEVVTVRKRTGYVTTVPTAPDLLGLIWAEDGRILTISGPFTVETLLAIAESLQPLAEQTPLATPTPVTATTTVSTAQSLYFPQDQLTAPYSNLPSEQAELEGKIALIYGCVGVINADQQPIIVIWPPEYLLAQNDGQWQIRGRAGGARLATIGDTIALGGGFHDAGRAQWLARDTLPATCVDPFAGHDAFFIAGSSLKVIQPAPSALPAVTATPVPTVEPATLDPNFNTILLYSAQMLNPAAPLLSTWGLRAWPDGTTPFYYSTLDNLYGDLGTGENYPGYFLNFRPQQSPDGQYVLVPGIGGYNPPEKPGTGLWLVGLQETIVRRLLKTVPVAVWSPQSDAIAYVEGDTLYRYNLDDDTPQPLFRHADLTSPYLAWSPDGNWLAVVTTAQGAVDPKTNYPALTQTVWLVSPSSEEARELATVPARPIQAVNAELAWSADSQHLKLRNYVLALDGKQLDLGVIVRTNGVDWLPTTPQLLVNRAEGLQLVDIEGKTVRTLSSQPAEVWAFTPDGQRLAYVLEDTAQNKRQVVIFDLQAQQESFRATLAGDYSTLSLLRWNPNGDLLYFDDWGDNSPIWALPIAPPGEATVAEPAVVVADGLLVEVLTRPGIDLSVPADADALAGRGLERWSSASPDGEWVAEGLAAFPQVGPNIYYTELRVKRVDGGAEWIPVAVWHEFLLGYTTPRPLRWSPDGRYLYFTNIPVPDGCVLFLNAVDLQRLDLADGTVREILPFGATQALTITPDAAKALYSQGGELHLLELATSDYAAIKVAGLEAGAQWGNFVWSPDDRQVAFTIAHHPCMAPGWSHSLLLLDTQTLTVTTVLDKDPRHLTITEWVDADHLVLGNYDNKQWLLDLTTGATEEITEQSGLTKPSPRPTPTIITAATADQEASPPFSFPQDQTIVTSDTVRIFNTALVEGELALVNNCVAMLDRARQPVMVIWPPEYVMNDNHGRIQLIKQRSGTVLAQLGDNIALTGGYETMEIAQRVAGSSLPQECTPAATGVDAFFLAAPMLEVKEAYTRTPPALETLTAGSPNQSPDGQWRAVVRTNLQADNTMRWFYVALQVTSSDGQTTWTPIAEERAYGLGYSLPAVVQWSKDGQALYYTEAYHPDGCVIFGGGSGLWRLDLASGQVTAVLSASWDLAISPDETMVAYTGAVLDELSLRNLATRETHGIKLPMLAGETQLGSIVWSPDSQRLAFTIAYEPCLPSAWSQSIVVVDVQTRTTRVLIEKDKRLFVAQAWLDEDRIQVSDRDGKIWEVDVATGSLATGEEGLFQMERTQMRKPPFESTCPVTQPDANFWAGTGPVAGFFPVWVTTYGEEDWSMLWRDVLPPGGVKLGFERGKLSGKRLVFIDQSVQGDLQITGKEWNSNAPLYFPSGEMLTTLDEQTDQLTEIPPTTLHIPDATTLDRTPNPPGKATRGWGFLLPHPGCYEFTFTIAEHTMPIVMEFVEPAVLAQRQAARAAAMEQIRVFANDPKLQVNFVGVSASSYAPVATYLFTTTTAMVEVDANTNAVIGYGPRSLGPGETPPTYDLTPRYTPAELEVMARKLIATYSPATDLTQLTPQHGNKEQTAYFFRWEDMAHRVEWGHPFVQVGLTRGGDLISYTNTVALTRPFVKEGGDKDNQ